MRRGRLLKKNEYPVRMTTQEEKNGRVRVDDHTGEKTARAVWMTTREETKPFKR